MRCLPRRGRVALAVLLASFVFAAMAPPVATADITGTQGTRWPRPGEPAEKQREPWQTSRLTFALGVAFPTTFPAGWEPGNLWAIAALKPVSPAIDVSLLVEWSDHPFDAAELTASGATLPPGSTTASFTDLALGIHVHPAKPGLRPYLLGEFVLPGISRPAIVYSDASGTHTIEGSEMFGWDPGFAFGAGVEYSPPSRMGGSLEFRTVIAPGRTEPTEAVVIVRAGLTVPLPR